MWLLIGFIGLQQLEGHVVSPQVFGHALRINPIVIIVSLLIGDALYGIIGSLVALPVAAVIRQTILYLRDHTVFESWGPPHLAAVTAGPDPPGPGPPGEDPPWDNPLGLDPPGANPPRHDPPRQDPLAEDPPESDPEGG